ncbi:MAG TPA: pectinesterase family protein [Chitinophagaceae bacterium]
MKKIVTILCLTIISCATWGQQQTYPSALTVAQDGSGNYKTIQEAINQVRAYSPVPITITIKNGVYHEKVIVPSWVTNITFVGESREQTIITNDDYSGKYIARGDDTLTNKTKFSTFTSYTMWVQGNDVTIRNLTIRNTAGRVGQAVALHVDGDRFVMKDCNVLGNQDTLLTANDSTRQYYYNSFIEGTTDFIFGPATALFQNCTIKSLTNSYITAASTGIGKKYGYVFINCKLIASDEAQKVYLGRPWRPYAKTVFIHCEMGNHIRPEGWDNWRNPENEKTAFYAEYKNYGEGARPAARVKWSKQLSSKEARQYTLKKILGANDNWRLNEK